MRNTGALVPLLMWALWSLADSAAVSNYTSGSTCSDDVDAQKALLGKHLNVMELAWAPFAIVDSSAPKGWSGYDIDLLDELATFLGFTYDIVDIGYPDTVGGQTWTSHAANNIDNGDLLMSFWFKNLERLKHLILLDGHVDVSPSLIARREVHSKRTSLVAELVTRGFLVTSKTSKRSTTRLVWVRYFLLRLYLHTKKTLTQCECRAVQIGSVGGGMSCQWIPPICTALYSHEVKII